ncbi:MAG: hypothetical protein ACJ71P_08605 [Nitrososphaeraceae archaeon]
MAYILSAKLGKGSTIDDAINIVAVNDIIVVNSNTNPFLLLGGEKYYNERLIQR